MSFEALGLHTKTLQAIAEVGYKSPTPIQAQAIPSLLGGRDVMALAQTGTGKTAAFVLPILDILARGRAKARMPRCIIIEPTRELAVQVAEDFALYGKYHNFTVALLIGGESVAEQERQLAKNVDVLIVTPGRLLDMHERGKILLNDVRVFVIDEADRMLDMGFIPDIERIASLLPSRQTALFSATMPPPIRKLAQKFLQTPEEIMISSSIQPAASVDQYVVRVLEKDKQTVLQSLLKEQNASQAIVFCNRKREVDVVFNFMKKQGVNVGALHGDLSQTLRNETLKAFKEGGINLLIASDVAARGLDVEELPVVINFHVPGNGEDYIHRIGRTGRAGREGKAFTLVSPKEEKQLQFVLKDVKKTVKEYKIGHASENDKVKPPPPAPKKQVLPSNLPIIIRAEVGFGENIPAFMQVKA